MKIRTEIISTILGTEGGYVNNPDDSGGATRWGITERVARTYGYSGSMRDFPKEAAIRIYEDQYWDDMRLDEFAEISPAIAYVLMDIGVNAGIDRAGKLLQRFLNVMNQRGQLYRDLIVDGAIGSRTLAAFRAYYRHRKAEGLTVMAESLKAMQLVYYINLAERREKDETFAYGWAVRAFKRPQIMEA